MRKIPIGVLKYEEMEWIDFLEAFLRRSVLVSQSFVLKGSLLTRQYFPDPKLRSVEDIDFWYIEKISDRETAYKIFTDWLIQITEIDLNDGIKFRSFREHPLWNNVEYFMAYGSPTVQTDLIYGPADEDEDEFEDFLMLEVTFNLMDVPTVPLHYQTRLGDRIVLPRTPSLSAQIAWKLHQTIVRPRFKDLYDLRYLLAHPSFDEQVRNETLQILLNECSLDPSVTKEQIRKVLIGDFTDLYPLVSDDYELNRWAGVEKYWLSKVHWDEGDEERAKAYFHKYVTELRQVMDKVGMDEKAFQHLPDPLV